MNSFREWHLDTHQLGRRVLEYDLVNSTSTRCLQFAGDERNHGLAILAHAQNAGRGQHGRSWLCEPGAGVLLSMLLFPPRELCRPAILTAWAAVSVCALIEGHTKLQTRIKWPNDVLIEGRKVCGILIEQNRGVVAGIGLNLNQTAEAFREANLLEAGSLRAFTGERYDVEDMARRLIRQLDEQYRVLLNEGSINLESCWRERLGLVDELVEIESIQGQYSGRLREVRLDGMILETDSGEYRQLAPESIKQIRLANG